MIAIIFALALQTSGWLVNDTRSPLDGKRSFVAGVESVTPIRNMRGRDERAMLAVGCIDGRRRVMLQWPSFVGAGEVLVTWRIGVTEARTDRFAASTGTSAVLSGRAADRMISAMNSGEVAYVRVQGYQDTQETSFDLSGASEHLTRLAEACPR